MTRSSLALTLPAVAAVLWTASASLADDIVRCGNPLAPCDEWLGVYTGTNPGIVDQAYSVRASHDGTRVFVTGHIYDATPAGFELARATSQAGGSRNE